MRLLGMTDGVVDSLRLTDSEKMTKQPDRWFGEMAGSKLMLLLIPMKSNKHTTGGMDDTDAYIVYRYKNSVADPSDWFR
jgi:hypothetical protein